MDRCCDQGRTLVLLKNKDFSIVSQKECEYVFGGYSNVGWKKDEKVVTGSNTFVFSVDRESKYSVSDQTVYINQVGKRFGLGEKLIDISLD